MAYAEKTSVDFNKSISQIMKILRDSGAMQTAQAEDEDLGVFVVQFRLLKQADMESDLKWNAERELKTRDG